VIAGQDKNDLLRELAATTVGAKFVCSSSSMQPTIAVGQSVLVHRVSPRDLRVGDVVVFEAAEVFILHRVVLISPSRRWFFHIGDAASREAPRRAMMASIVGRVRAIPRNRPSLPMYGKIARGVVRGATRKCRRYFYW